MSSSISEDNNLIVAQYRSFAQKMPPIYAGLSLAMACHIYSFWSIVPWVWSVLCPSLLMAGAMVRGIWWFRHRNTPAASDVAQSRLQRATRLLFAAALVVALMDYMAVPYLDLHGKYYLVVELLVLSVVSCVSLIHLRHYANLVAGVVNLAMLYVCWSMNDFYASLSAAIAVLFLAVLHACVISYYNDFKMLEQARREAQRLSSRNAALASSDMLTGLPNRRHFFAMLDRVLERARMKSRRFAVGILDLDGFKPVNDSYGHRVGDLVLCEVANRLTSSLGKAVSFYRLGGDEYAFIVILKGDDAPLKELGQTMISLIEAPMTFGDVTVAVSGSVGMAVCPDMAEAADRLFEYADFALYHAKRTGRARAEVFSPVHREELRAQGAIEQAIRVADMDAEFYPMFQPIVDTETGTTQHLEALARWNSPVLGAVSPSQFVPVAERAGLISAITLVMLRKSTAAMRHWPDHVGLSFNLSACDIINSVMIMRLITEVEQSGVNPRRIVFELTETALLQDFSLARENIELLRRAGIHVALDDFGTGYSSLSHVQNLPLDKLKIDQRFVADIENNQTNQMIVRSLITLCRGIGISCVVEGAETNAQVEALRELGCHSIQGYFFAKPMSEQDVVTYLNVPAEGLNRLAG
ncbi:putative bifunctional diguanylate cyclase/phosphodiesterase [Rhizobium sp. C4]|uniref:putative bifunctional diguanylate cyclase/phosphodiesterase n=1 Tax=Rhizobium sp. C4 TaxID=1349800 RepID=UPI001E4E7084|nr:EAL domain-containing protein [Rhizobium sp. C4]MCD2175585.1 EAL domain-containing protein [Rhizobium sp. C4]